MDPTQDFIVLTETKKIREFQMLQNDSLNEYDGHCYMIFALCLKEIRMYLYHGGFIF